MFTLRITGIALTFFLTNFCMAADPTNAVPMSVKLEVSNAEEYIERPIAIAGVTPGGGGGVSSAVVNLSSPSPGASAATSSTEEPKKYFNNVESGESYIIVKATITPNWIPVSNLTWTESASEFERVTADTYRISRNSSFEWKTAKVTLNFSGSSCTTKVEVGNYEVEELITPAGDPVGAPKDSGDGQNEYTYSTSPSATFAINYKAKIKPATMAKPAAQKITFKEPIIDGSAPVWDAANPGGQATHGGDPHVVAKLVMTGMPNTNAEFGEKKVKMKDKDVFVKIGGVEVEQKIEVFFPKHAKNNPIDPAVENWFAYWKEGGVVPAMNTEGVSVVYADQPGGPVHMGKFNPPNEVVLYGGSAGASGENKQINVGKSTEIDPPDTSYLVPGDYTDAKEQKWAPPHETFTNSGGVTFFIYPAIGLLGAKGKGIRSVAIVMRHELKHKSLKELPIPQDENNNYDNSDNDNDGIYSLQEKTLDGLGTSWRLPDTYKLEGMFPGSNYGLNGDQELRARKAEGLITSSDYVPSKDWANPGWNSKTTYGPGSE